MQVERSKENLSHCICTSCPTYTLGCKVKNMPENLLKLAENLEKVDHYEKMFCAFDKSHCIKEDKGCICADCEVHRKYNLNRQDYCIVTGGIFEYAASGKETVQH